MMRIRNIQKKRAAHNSPSPTTPRFPPPPTCNLQHLPLLMNTYPYSHSHSLSLRLCSTRRRTRRTNSPLSQLLSYCKSIALPREPFQELEHDDACSRTSLTWWWWWWWRRVMTSRVGGDGEGVGAVPGALGRQRTAVRGGQCLNNTSLLIFRHRPRYLINNCPTSQFHVSNLSSPPLGPFGNVGGSQRRRQRKTTIVEKQQWS